MPQIWKSPDGQHYEIASGGGTQPTYRLWPAVQDVVTAQWSVDHTAATIEIEAGLFRETYVEVPPEPLRDPRITRLTGLITELLADYERTAERPAATASEIREALEQVSAIPEEARRRRHAAALNAQRAAGYRGRGR